MNAPTRRSVAQDGSGFEQATAGRGGIQAEDAVRRARGGCQATTPAVESGQTSGQLHKETKSQRALITTLRSPDFILQMMKIRPG